MHYMQSQRYSNKWQNLHFNNSVSWEIYNRDGVLHKCNQKPEKKYLDLSYIQAQLCIPPIASSIHTDLIQEDQPETRGKELQKSREYAK